MSSSKLSILTRSLLRNWPLVRQIWALRAEHHDVFACGLSLDTQYYQLRTTSIRTIHHWRLTMENYQIRKEQGRARAMC